MRPNFFWYKSQNQKIISFPSFCLSLWILCTFERTNNTYKFFHIHLLLYDSLRTYERELCCVKTTRYSQRGPPVCRLFVSFFFCRLMSRWVSPREEKPYIPSSSYFPPVWDSTWQMMRRRSLTLSLGFLHVISRARFESTTQKRTKRRNKIRKIKWWKKKNQREDMSQHSSSPEKTTTRSERGRGDTKRKEKEPFIIKSFKSGFPPLYTTAESNIQKWDKYLSLYCNKNGKNDIKELEEKNTEEEENVSSKKQNIFTAIYENSSDGDAQTSVQPRIIRHWKVAIKAQPPTRL